jgi:hypothetical protein
MRRPEGDSFWVEVGSVQKGDGEEGGLRHAFTEIDGRSRSGKKTWNGSSCAGFPALKASGTRPEGSTIGDEIAFPNRSPRPAHRTQPPSRQT